ncbi:host cell division inhibitory peptide Kil [Parabacteroides goldsteinii]
MTTTIDKNQWWCEIDHDVMTEEKLHQINNFWSDSEYRLKPVNYVTDGNALSTYLISQESQRMDQTLMAIQTKFTIATFIGDEKMFREAVDAYKKWILILKLRSSKSIH